MNNDNHDSNTNTNTNNVSINRYDLDLIVISISSLSCRRGPPRTVPRGLFIKVSHSHGS